MAAGGGGGQADPAVVLSSSSSASDGEDASASSGAAGPGPGLAAGGTPALQPVDPNKPREPAPTAKCRHPGVGNNDSGVSRYKPPGGKVYFGEIRPEHDTSGEKKGQPVGATFENRVTCANRGVHRPNVAAVAGQREVGVQSIVLSNAVGNRDGGDWIVYMGPGGKDLSGNKRSGERQQIASQSFDKGKNAALKLTCVQGLPVRVVRSCKAPSRYAPPGDKKTGKLLRYDGLYRIVKCWLAQRDDRYTVCYYLFVRADNASPPWDTSGAAEPLPLLPRGATSVSKMGAEPAWVRDSTEQWGWAPNKEPPAQRVND